MFKILFAFILIPLFFSGNVHATSLIDGCYKTLEINGKTVVPGPDEERSQSEIYSVQNEFFYDLETRRSLKTKVISIFTGFDGTWYSFSNPLMFEELGKLEFSESSLSYSFQGNVFYRNSSYALVEVDFKTDIKMQKHAGILTGSISQLSNALARSTEMKVVLKEVSCPE